jgi:hypothetical protein
MSVIADLFAGFAEHRIKTDSVEILLRTVGAGTPLLRQAEVGVGLAERASKGQ